MTLQEIEAKLTALRERYEELDEKHLVPKRDGVIDGTVSNAMGKITIEIGRLEKLRERALLSDLIGEDGPAETTKIAPAPKASLPPLPIDQEYKAPPPDPFLNLNCLPTDEKELDELRLGLSHEATFSFQELRRTFQRTVPDGLADRPVTITQGTYMALVTAIARDNVIARMIGAMGRDRCNALEKRVAELEARPNAALEKRVAELEARPTFKYRGIHIVGEQYNAGDFVTSGGCLWYAHISTRQQPGQGPDWQLAVKKGRDGKDAR